VDKILDMMHMVTPCYQQLGQHQSSATENFDGIQLVHQPQPMYLISQNMIPIQYSGGIQILPPMQLSNPMIPKMGINNIKTDRSVGTQQAVYQSEGFDFLGYLKGSWDTGVPHAPKIEVVIVAQGDQRHAVVRAARLEKDAVPHQLILEQDTRITLYSFDGYVEAVMLKGSIMKDYLKWYTNDGTWIEWRRTCCNWQDTSSISSHNLIKGDDNVVVSKLSTKRFAPAGLELHTEHSEKVSNNSSSTNTSDGSNQFSSCSNSQKSRIMDHYDLFDVFRSHCKKYPDLIQKVLNWGIPLTEDQRVSEKDIAKLSDGRVWLCARLLPFYWKVAGRSLKIVDEFKGAYLEDTPGVYLQPSQPNEPGAQYRLRKRKRGLWIIEVYNLERDAWVQCAYERSNGLWIDFKTKRQLYKVQILPLLSILSRMKDDWTDLAEMKRSIEFLYHDCNSKKLSTKLKPRSLKHNKNNLREKLKKQYALSFAVRVSETADLIALRERHGFSLDK
jgi:hypothetical protein